MEYNKIISKIGNKNNKHNQNIRTGNYLNRKIQPQNNIKINLEYNKIISKIGNPKNKQNQKIRTRNYLNRKIQPQNNLKTSENIR
jgi:hypothetical protein